jgi:hypothetical protein
VDDIVLQYDAKHWMEPVIELTVDPLFSLRHKDGICSIMTWTSLFSFLLVMMIASLLRGLVALGEDILEYTGRVFLVQ